MTEEEKIRRRLIFGTDENIEYQMLVNRDAQRFWLSKSIRESQKEVNDELE